MPDFPSAASLKALTQWDTPTICNALELTNPERRAYGCFGLCAAYLILVAAALCSGGGNASWLWLLAYFAVLTLGELYLSPVGLSFVTKIAPVRMLSMMMGIWLAASFTGGFLAGYIGSLWRRMAKPEFFLLVAGVVVMVSGDFG